MKSSQIGIVYRKEMLDTLRDRRTLMSMIVVPLLVIPGLMFGLTEVTMKTVRKAAQDRATVMILGEQYAPDLAARIRANNTLEILPASDDYVAMIEAKDLRAVIEFPQDFEAKMRNESNSVDLEIRAYFYEGEIRSEFAADKLENIVQRFRDQVVEERLAARQISTDLLQPFEFKSRNVASAGAVGGATFGGFLPYMVILLTLTGAMYPAIDLTAGEKERGTIETILASRVSRASLATGKFLTVLTAALATALLSLASLMISSRLFASGDTAVVASGLGFLTSINVSRLAAMLIMVLPVAVMFSGVLLAIALLAKSYKEAQSYISPLMILVIAPAVASLLPGIEMNLKLALIPILNVSLISKELLSGKMDWNWILIIFASSCAYAAIAVAVASATFNRESVLFRT